MKAKLWMVMLCVTCSGPAVSGSFDFAPYAFYPMGSSPRSVAVGDVTGDGRADVVVATTFFYDPDNDYHVFVYPQRSDGALGAPIKMPYSEIAGDATVRLGDMNNDNMLDIVVGGGVLAVFIADGTGGFVEKRSYYDEYFWPYQIALSDIDLDGNLDVVAQDYYGLTVFFGDGLGGIRSRMPLETNTNSRRDVKAGDVNGDGRPDVVSVNGYTMTTYLNNGIGGFYTAQVYPPVDIEPSVLSVEIGDFDNDGRNDVALGNAANIPDSNVWVYTQNSLGALRPPYPLQTAELIYSLHAADLDNNGLQDLLTLTAGSSIGRYMHGSSGLTPQLVSGVPSNNGLTSGIAAGDVNGDGCTDAAMANNAVTGLVVALGKNCYEPWAMANHYNADFDGNGNTDILWRHSATGQNAIWKNGDAAKSVNLTGVTDMSWKLVGTGDFDGDHKSDLLWHNDVTGRNAIWKEGDARKALNLTTVAQAAWRIVGLGDFDGDGTSDILWRQKYSGANALWKSGNYSAQIALPILQADWQVAGVGDFDGDRRAEILWRNTADGRNAVWKPGTTVIARNLATVADSYWQVAGIGDFDGDHRADILWHHALTAANGIWKSGNAATQQGVTPVTNNSWKISAIGDFDGNGTSDLLWRNRRTGAGTIWRGANAASVQPMATVANINWRIVR